MPQVVIEINGRTYTMECGEGQEDHLRRLARGIDEELARIREMAGPVGEIRLLIMTALVIADRAVELEEKLQALERQLEELQAAGLPEARQLAETLQKASERLEGFARASRVASVPGNG